jgi:Mrp family chromosome partitioning ATPase/uncharacterized protein involved in exopolysaccharide biosynthesis
MADIVNLPSRGIKPLVSLIAHPRLALAVFLMVLLAGIPVIVIKGQTLFATTATVQVAPRYMKNLRDDGELSFPSNTQYREFLEHQARSVLRYDIVQDALRSQGDKARIWRLPAESERLAIDRLRSQMAVRTIPDTYMVEISLQSEKKDGLADIVNAVVKTYIDRMKVERIYGADVRQRNIEDREADLLRRIDQKTTQRTELGLQLGIGSFGEHVENPYDRVLNSQRAALSEARNKRFEAEARLAAFQKRGETDINTRSVQEAVLIDPGLANLKSNLYKRRAELLTQLSGLTTVHPAYTELTAEMKRIETEIETQISTLTRQVSGSVLARYQTTVDQARQIEAELSRDFSEQEKKGAHFASLYNQAMTLTHDLDQDRKELNVMRERLNEFAAEENSFGFVRLVTPALPPELPFGPGKKKLLLMVLIAALGAALLAPVGRDLLDRRIHTVNDAERVLGIPAMGWLMENSDSASAMFGEDQLRRMAGSLIREQDEHGTHVFTFSSVKPGAGSSEMVLALGRTLSALGYPTLVVEANAFKPDARMRNGAVDDAGLAQCLAGQAEAALAVVPESGKLPAPVIRQAIRLANSVIPATGKLPARVWVGDTNGRRHIDQLDRIDELITRWRAQFRFVLVDIPPLLLSADAEILARNLQHLVLVVEAASITRGELHRAGRQIEKIAPAAVGVVVNRVNPFEGGGYLREMLVEYLTGRKAAEYFTQPGWFIAIRGHLAMWPTWPFLKLKFPGRQAK